MPERRESESLGEQIIDIVTAKSLLDNSRGAVTVSDEEGEALGARQLAEVGR